MHEFLLPESPETHLINFSFSGGNSEHSAFVLIFLGRLFIPCTCEVPRRGINTTRTSFRYHPPNKIILSQVSCSQTDYPIPSASQYGYKEGSFLYLHFLVHSLGVIGLA